jgi:hypothetical protein
VSQNVVTLDGEVMAVNGRILAGHSVGNGRSLLAIGLEPETRFASDYFRTVKAFFVIKFLFYFTSGLSRPFCYQVFILFSVTVHRIKHFTIRSYNTMSDYFRTVKAFFVIKF